MIRILPVRKRTYRAHGKPSLLVHSQTQTRMHTSSIPSVPAIIKKEATIIIFPTPINKPTNHKTTHQTRRRHTRPIQIQGIALPMIRGRYTCCKRIPRVGSWGPDNCLVCWTATWSLLWPELVGADWQKEGQLDYTGCWERVVLTLASPLPIGCLGSNIFWHPTNHHEISNPFPGQG